MSTPAHDVRDLSESALSPPSFSPPLSHNELGGGHLISGNLGHETEVETILCDVYCKGHICACGAIGGGWGDQTRSSGKASLLLPAHPAFCTFIRAPGGWPWRAFAPKETQFTCLGSLRIYCLVTVSVLGLCARGCVWL